MKTLKIIDAAIQVIMLVFFVVIFATDSLPGTFFPAYFIVGGYQLFSCLLQLSYQPGRYAPGARGLYQKMLIWLAVLGIVTIPVFMLFLYVLLFVSPLLAVFYTWLSVAETIKLVRSGRVQNEFSPELNSDL